MISELKKYNFIDFLLLCSLVLLGGFNEYISCFLSVFLTGYLLYKIFKNNSIHIKINLMNISVALISVMYGLTAFWAIDSGMAFIGFLKFLPLLLYLISIWQTNKSDFEYILPKFAAILVCISVIGFNIKFTSSFFSVAGRLAGFFQYPNTFAIFLLVCELFLLSKNKFKIADYVCLLVLVFGLLYTGSRTVFVLAILSNIVLLLYKFRNGLNQKLFLIIVALFVAVSIVVFLFNKDLFSRYLSISLHESTFAGRILYWVDSIPLLLKYPFGMGYLGYNYIHSSIQTGVYTVRYIHNDFLQLLLDIGWIPTILFIVAIFKFLLDRKILFHKKLIIATICLHSFFDFNFQFISIFFIILLIINEQQGKKIIINKSLAFLSFSLIVLLILNLYMFLHLSLSHFNQNKFADSLYPWNTENKIAMLEKTTDINIANEIADAILKQNQHSYIPYSVKAKYFYSKGNFSLLFENKHIVFQKNPFGYEEYEEYCQMLLNGIYLYGQIGDINSIKYCQEELINTKNKLVNNIERLSYLGEQITDQPKTELPKEILDYINKIEKE